MNLNIEVKKNKVLLNGELWGNKPNRMDLGDYIVNLLYYRNREGLNQFTLKVNGTDETKEFQQAVKERYENGNLKRFLVYANCYEQYNQTES